MTCTQLTWRQLDQRILDGLRAAGEPVPADQMGYRFKIDYLTTPSDRQRSLERLEADGLVRKLNHIFRDKRMPLLIARAVVAYEPTEVVHGNQ